ncbi:MAG: hypothetical protein KF812_04045 [Fimbriimonadaceae bacterium]|nr:hypothetical protein [Fimbriimonadaceae bacterium]
MRGLQPLRALRYSDTYLSQWGEVVLAGSSTIRADGPPLAASQLRFPERRADDRSKFVQYARAAAALEEGRREGDLIVTDLGYGWVTGEGTALIGLAHLDELPPTKDAAPDEARLRLLEATWTQIEPIVLSLPALPEPSTGDTWECGDWAVNWVHEELNLTLEHSTLISGADSLASARRFREERGPVRSPRPDDWALVALISASAAVELPTGLAYFSLRDA